MKKFTMYPVNLIKAILNIDCNNPLPFDISEDRLYGLVHAISLLLPREKLIIYSRYLIGNGLKVTAEMVSKEFDVACTPERVRLMEVNALRKLKHSENFDFIALGYKETIRLHPERTPVFELPLKDTTKDILYCNGTRTVHDIQLLMENKTWYKDVKHIGVKRKTEIEEIMKTFNQ